MQVVKLLGRDIFPSKSVSNQIKNKKFLFCEIEFSVHAGYITGEYIDF